MQQAAHGNASRTESVNHSQFFVVPIDEGDKRTVRTSSRYAFVGGILDVHLQASTLISVWTFCLQDGHIALLDVFPRSAGMITTSPLIVFILFIVHYFLFSSVSLVSGPSYFFSLLSWLFVRPGKPLVYFMGSIK